MTPYFLGSWYQVVLGRFEPILNEQKVGDDFFLKNDIFRPKFIIVLDFCCLEK